jgi:hypothetical protein
MKTLEKPMEPARGTNYNRPAFGVRDELIPEMGDQQIVSWLDFDLSSRASIG